MPSSSSSSSSSSAELKSLFSAGVYARAIIASQTRARPSNNTVSSANGGQMSVLYNSRFVGPSIRAKTLNPLFNWLDQFSSTHIPLQHSRIMTGYIHFILTFTRMQTANKSEEARRGFAPNSRPRSTRDPLHLHPD